MPGGILVPREVQTLIYNKLASTDIFPLVKLAVIA
jgi:hypothetical protein